MLTRSRDRMRHPDATSTIAQGSSRTVISNTNVVTPADGQNKRPSACNGARPSARFEAALVFLNPCFLGRPTAARKIESSSLQFGLVQFARPPRFEAGGVEFFNKNGGMG